MLWHCIYSAPMVHGTVLSVTTETIGNKLNLVAVETSPPAGLSGPNRVFSYEQLVPATVVDYLSIPNNTANTISVLATPDAAPPAGMERLALVADRHLNTGILNPSASSPGLTVEFARPVVNGPGEDLIIFELTIGTGQTPDPLVVQQPGGIGMPRNILSGNYEVQGVIPAEATPNTFLTTVESSGTTNLTELTSEELTISGTTNPKWHAVAVNLSRLGVTEGQSVSAIEILSGDPTRAVDLLFIAGFPYAPLPGDYDGDSAITSADYEVWKTAFGTTVAAWSGADGNGDGIVDAADYVVLRSHLVDTTVGGALGSTNVVPEPPVTVLVGFLLALPTIHRRHII
jgi:hypothetical protein